MQHVDDALLIARADDALPEAERRAVDTHLAECAECRARVEEERALARRANEVLAVAAPADMPVPPFEDVLRRRSTRPAPARSTWLPLAWAASLIVALGAGWIAHALLLAPESGAPAGRAVTADAVPAPASQPMTPVPEPRAADVAGAGVDEAVQAAAPPTRPSAPASEPTPAPAIERQAASLRAEAGAEQKAAAPPEAMRAAAEADAIGLAATTAPVVTMALDAADVAWRGSTVAAAPVHDAPVRGIPGLAVDSVWLASDSADWRARVWHRLDTGALEVIEWRRAPWQGVVASGSLGDGRRYLHGRSDGVLIELRARLDTAALEALLARIQPLP